MAKSLLFRQVEDRQASWAASQEEHRLQLLLAGSEKWPEGHGRQTEEPW